MMTDKCAHFIQKTVIRYHEINASIVNDYTWKTLFESMNSKKMLIGLRIVVQLTSPFTSIALYFAKFFLQSKKECILNIFNGQCICKAVEIIYSS